MKLSPPRRPLAAFTALVLLVIMMRGTGAGPAARQISLVSTRALASASAPGASVVAAAPATAAQASGSDQESRVESADIPLSLPAAIEAAFVSGPALRLAHLQLARNRLQVERKIDEGYTVPEDVYTPADAEAWEGVPRRLDDIQASAAEAGYREAERDLRRRVVDAYHTLLQGEDSVILAEANLERARQDLEIARLQYEAGERSELEFLQAEEEAAAAETAWRKAIRTRTNYRIALNRLIGWGPDDQPTLTTPLGELARAAFPAVADPVQPEAGLPDLRSATDHALKHRPDLVRAGDLLDLDEISFRIVQGFYPPNVYDYREAEIDIQEARIRFEQKREQVMDEVRAAYFELVDATEQIPILRRRLERSRKIYRGEIIKYESGLSSARDLAATRRALQEAEDAVSEALFRYSRAQSDFILSVALELPASPRPSP